MFCNLWVTQKPLLGGFPGKGPWQHRLRMEELWLAVPCLLRHLLPAVSGSGFSLRLLTLHSVGPQPQPCFHLRMFVFLCPRVYPRFPFLPFRRKFEVLFYAGSSYIYPLYYQKGKVPSDPSVEALTPQDHSDDLELLAGWSPLSPGPHIVGVLGTGRDWLSVADVNGDIAHLCSLRMIYSLSVNFAGT